MVWGWLGISPSIVGIIPNHPQTVPQWKQSPNHPQIIPSGTGRMLSKHAATISRWNMLPTPREAGSSPQNSKIRKFSMIFGNSHLMIDHEKIQFLHLVPLENRNLPRVRFSYFLDRFMSTFSDRNHSVELQDLKLSTENLVAFLFCKVQWPVALCIVHAHMVPSLLLFMLGFFAARGHTIVSILSTKMLFFSVEKGSVRVRLTPAL